MKIYTRLTKDERVEIKVLRDAGYSYERIGISINRNKSTVYRELRRFPLTYTSEKGEEDSKRKMATRHMGLKLDKEPKLFNFVYKHLKCRWSPEQISQELKRVYPTTDCMHISHESIYTYIYLLPRGELKKELIGYLRQEKRKRYSRKGRQDKRGRIQDMISIEERPAMVESRSLAGHWEGDLIIGRRHQSAIGTIVERKTRAVILVPLKDRDPRNIRKAFERELKTLPKQMRQSMTYDQGYEMIEHKLFTRNIEMKVYFCDPASPWQRGTCENTNMLIRSFFPKGTDFNKVSKAELKKVQKLLNERPRKTLNWETPKAVFDKEVLMASG